MEAGERSPALSKLDVEHGVQLDVRRNTALAVAK